MTAIRSRGLDCRRVLAPLVVLLLALALTLSSGTTVLAHANLASADPAPNSVVPITPPTVILSFTEPVVPSLSGIKVLDSQGKQVDKGDSTVSTTEPTVMWVSLPALPNGTYTVAWNTVSNVDGHAVRGSYFFSIGVAPSTVAAPPTVAQQPLFQSPVEPVLRWLELLGLMAVVGGLAFALLVRQPALGQDNPHPTLCQVEARLARRSLVLLWVGLVVSVVASDGRLVVQAANAYGTSLLGALGSPVASVLFDTNFGHLWLWRLVLLAGIAGVLLLGPFRSDRQGKLGTLLIWLGLALGAGALLTASLASHAAATVAVRGPALFSDYVHLLASSFWVGGLLHLLASIPILRQGLSSAARRYAFAVSVPRFSVVAALSLGALIITGLYSAWAQVTALAGIKTPYGLTLLVKAGLVLPLVGLGALNLLWVSPRLKRLGKAQHWLRSTVTGEVVLAALVVLSVGFLTGLEPARQVASRQQAEQRPSPTFQDTSEGTQINLEIRPGDVGPNKVIVRLHDRLGRPINNASDVSVKLVYLGSDLGAAATSASHAGDGSYVLDGPVISIAGPWQVEVAVVRPDALDARTAFRFQAVAVGAPSSATIAPGRATGKLLLGAELFLLGALLLATSIPLGSVWTRRGLAITAPGLACLLAGLLTVSLPSGGPAAPLTNPIVPNDASLQTGAALYQQYCQVCHGPEGHGDGPLAPTLTPRPLDLTVHVPFHAQGTLFRFIRDGVQGTAMSPWRGTLSNEQIWHLINYLETLAAKNTE